MARFGLLGAGTLVLGLVVSPLSCGDPFTVGAAGDDGGTGSGSGSSSGSDAQGSDGPAGDDASTDGTTPEGGPHDGAPADAPQEAPPGSVVYVSATSGNDGNDGTDPTKPKKTIAAALTRAQSITSGPEVHVCKGVYVEKGLSLGQTLQLLGAYDCTTWKRTATYGYPTFDQTNATTIQNGDPQAQPATLLVTGGVAPSATVDGFTIEGAASFGGTTVGVQTTGSASPVLQNDRIAGGAGNGGSTNPGSIGVLVSGGSPEVRSCAVSGGSGTGSSGSNGIVIASGGTPYVHDAAVSGGTGTGPSTASGLASAGITVAVSMSQANALKNLLVLGSDEAGATGSTVGIAVAGTGIDVDIESSAIHGGVGAASNTISAGVSVSDSGGTVRILGDRIDGGSRPGSGSSSYGVYVSAAGVLDVHNCEIHAGASAAGSVGVELVGGSSPSIVDDTIYTGASGVAAITVAQGITELVVTDDLLLGNGGSTGAAVSLGGTSCNQLSTLDHTAFVNFTTLYACGATLAATVSTMATALPGASTAGDVEIGSGGVCATPGQCVADPSCPGTPSTCISSILGASFTTNDDGVTGLFNGAPATATDAGTAFKGWTLPPGTLCAIARGGTPYAGITIDLFGQPRDPGKPSIGAFEYTLGKCN